MTGVTLNTQVTRKPQRWQDFSSVKKARSPVQGMAQGIIIMVQTASRLVRCGSGTVVLPAKVTRGPQLSG